MKMTIALASLAALLAAAASARIGETESQIVNRYGTNYTVFATAPRQLKFQTPNYRISVTFVNGKSASEYVALKDGRTWTEATQINLRNAIGGTNVWQTMVVKTNLVYFTPDRSIMCLIDDQSVGLTTDAAVEAREQAMTKDF